MQTREMRLSVLALLCFLPLLTLAARYEATGKPYNVSYDHRSMFINGQRALLASGSIHYPRSTPSMWPVLLKESKDAGIDLIQIYLFWNLHEPTRGVYNFDGNANVTQFLDYAMDAGLYINLRIGPYVCAEWNYGGFPVWLRDIPGMVFRDYNQPFMTEMARWMTYIVDKLRPYMASNGGPIILAQVENEYGWVENAYGSSGRQYALWSAQFANSLNIGIPWIMCSQDDVTTVIDTCNGFYCDNWLPGHFSAFPNQPALWTENWPGWFQNWGDAVPHRPTQDVMFSIARWVARGGTHFNYYMWHGGTTFGRWTGGPFIITSYDYDVALDEFGLPHNPKYTRSAQMHAVLHKFEDQLLNNNPPSPVSLGNNLEAHVYGQGSSALVFLSNIDSKNVGKVSFQGATYTLQPWSVQIVVNQKVIYDTSSLSMVETSYKNTSLARGRYHVSDSVPFAPSIGFWSEPTGVWGEGVTADRPLEQLSVTNDTSDYLWYTQKITVPSGGAALSLSNTNDIGWVFVDGKFIGGNRGSGVHVNIPSSMAGPRTLQILTVTVGLVNYGLHMEAVMRGIQGNVTLGSSNITSGTWTMQPGLKGEYLQIFSPSSNDKVSWNKNYTAGVNQPLTWFSSSFDVSGSANQLGWALDMTGMGKGQVWVNGNHLGRYWLIQAGQGQCAPCVYAGGYSGGDCRTGCGEPSQRYYHVPRDWLKASDNLLVVCEETGGDPSKIQLVHMSPAY
eukprot:TRINITY_DN1935_c0_g1_i2.p1 TRINITY_DN1935_c0_g1~~TRINITY_DN1935_c0_g1_i2.p1  ORF type:complete len:730 (-),score=170.45 TRINITY_DN1935_c0_g1_i2:65-2254(-)